MPEIRQGNTWGEAALAGLPHVLFPLITAISLISGHLKSVQINEDTAMLAFAGTIVVMLILAWQWRWPRWAAGWIGYGLIVAWIAPFASGGGYTVRGWLSSRMPSALADLFFFAQILFALGVGFLLARRDRLSGLLVALPAVPMCWSWLESDVIYSAISLPLFIGAGLATALTTAIMVRSGRKKTGIRLALLINILIRPPFTYARLYHHDVLLPPTTLEAISVSVRDVVISTILVTGPLWGWALWEEQGRRLVARSVRRDERDVPGPRLRTIASVLRRALRKWWLIGAILASTGVLVIGARPCGWLDVALNVSGCECTLEKHDSPVQSVAFSPDGTLLASGSGDGTVRLWQVADRTLLRTLEMPTTGDAGYSYDIAFSPDGTTLAVGLPDGTVRLRRVSDGTLLRTLQENGAKICSLAFSPDGQILASGSWDGTIRLWQAANGTPLRTLTGHGAGVLDLAYSPDGSMLASASFDGEVQVWRTAEGTRLYTSKPVESVVEGVAFSPDGSMLALGAWDGWVQVWRVPDWGCLRVMKSESSGINDLAFSPDGTILAAGDSWHRIQWWRVADGTRLHNVGGHENTVESVSFSPDGESLASGSLDGTVRLWRLPRGAKSETAGAVDDIGPVQMPSSRVTLESAGLLKPRSMKGYELYSWQTQGEWTFALVIGTNRIKTYEEISSPEARIRGLEALKSELDRLSSGEQVFWSTQRVGNTALPPNEMIEEIKAYCRQRCIKLAVDPVYQSDSNPDGNGWSTASKGTANTSEKDIVIGYIRDWYEQDGHRYISFDEIEWRTSADAAEAMREDGLCDSTQSDCEPPNGFYIQNQDERLVAFRVSQEAAVLMQTLSHGPDGNYNWDERIELDRFLQILDSDSTAHLRSVPYQIILSDGVVTAMREQYVP